MHGITSRTAFAVGWKAGPPGYSALDPRLSRAAAEELNVRGARPGCYLRTR